MKRYFVSFLCLSFALIFVVNHFVTKSLIPVKVDAMALNDANTSAKAMIVMETLHDKVLYSKNKDMQLPMASTTKIVTAITVIENCDNLDELITVPRKATLVEGSSIYLRENEKLSIRDLLYGLMLQSGNDAAETLALHIGDGSIERFAELMNETAKKCGAQNSNFVTPHGLDDKDHYTTAYDLAKITSYALKNPVFQEIVSTKKHVIKATEHNTARTLLNKNKLLNSLEGCDGVKTGYTKKSGRCLVSSCTRDGMQVVCVVLNDGPMFEDSINLINKAFNEYKLYEVLPSYKFVDDITVEDGKSETLRLYNKDGYSVVATEEEIKNYKVEYDYEKIVKAPVEKDTKLGEVKIYYDNSLIFTENLYNIESVEGLDPVDKLKDILEKW